MISFSTELLQQVEMNDDYDDYLFKSNSSNTRANPTIKNNL